MSSGIYVIENTLNGKRYVGSTGDFKRRQDIHWSKLQTRKHHSLHLQSAWNKYGEGAFEFRPLLICEPDDLLNYEQLLLDKWHPEYNMAPNADGLRGYRRSSETRRKMSLAQMGNKKMLGRKHSDETKAKIGEANALALKGNKIWLGKKHTQEAKDKMRKAKLGRKLSKETRAKMSESHKKRHQHGHTQR